MGALCGRNGEEVQSGKSKVNRWRGTPRRGWKNNIKINVN
jgi:hypothetical protein